MAPTKPVITVVGSTSKQGYSVAKSLLETGIYTVRALTRSAGGEWAKKLAEQGAEVIEGDPAREADLRAVFAGAWGVFAITFVLVATGDLQEAEEEEYALGQLQADAAAAEGVKVFLFSILEDVNKRTKGKYSAPLFTAKGRLQPYVQERYPQMTAVFPSFAVFYTNWIEYYPPKRAADGVLEFTLPTDGNKRQPYIDPIRSPGPAVAAIFKYPEKYAGQFVAVYDELLTPIEMVETITRVTGIPARFVESSKEGWFEWLSAWPAPAVQSLWDMYQYHMEFGYFAPERDMQLTRDLYPDPFTYAAFLKTSGYDGTQDIDTVRRKLQP